MRTSKRKWVVPLILFAGSLIFNLTLNKSIILDGDEAALVMKSVGTLNGELPLVDFVGFTYPLGRYFLLALLFTVFSPSVAVERLFFVVLRSLVNVLMYLFATKLLPKGWTFLPVAMIGVMACFPWKTLLPFVTLLNLIFLEKLAAAPLRKKALLSSAVVAGFTLGFRQDIALYAWAAAALLIAWQVYEVLPETESGRFSAPAFLKGNLKHQSRYFLTMAGVFSPLAAFYLLKSHGIKLLYEMFIGRPADHLRVVAHYSHHFPSLGKTLQSPLDGEKIFLWIFLLILPATAALLLTRVFRERRLTRENQTVLAILVIAVLSFSSETFVYAIFERLLQGATALYLLTAYLLSLADSRLRALVRAKIRRPALRRAAAAGALALLLSGPVAFSVYGLAVKNVNDRLTLARDKNAYIVSPSGIGSSRKRIQFVLHAIQAKLAQKNIIDDRDVLLYAEGSLIYYTSTWAEARRLDFHLKPLKPSLLEADLGALRPRFLLIQNSALYVVKKFPERLRRKIEDEYAPALQKSGFTVYRLRDGT